MKWVQCTLTTRSVQLSEQNGLAEFAFQCENCLSGHYGSFKSQLLLTSICPIGIFHQIYYLIFKFGYSRFNVFERPGFVPRLCHNWCSFEPILQPIMPFDPCLRQSDRSAKLTPYLSLQIFFHDIVTRRWNEITLPIIDGSL